MGKGISETAFATTVEDLLTRFGWRWVHIRPAWSERGWRTPIRGSDPDGFKGKGHPDYTAVRPPRLLFIELKDQHTKPTPEQEAWLGDLRECEISILREPLEVGRSIEVYLWRPYDIEPNGGTILKVLR